jgi:hypothetical protein
MSKFKAIILCPNENITGDVGSRLEDISSDENENENENKNETETENKLEFGTGCSLSRL